MSYLARWVCVNFDMKTYYHQTHVVPTVSAEEILAGVLAQIWASTIMIDEQAKLEVESPREAFDAQTNMYAGRVHRALLVQIWEDATGATWPGSESSD